MRNYDVEHAFRSAIFQVVSFITTTGLFNDDAAVDVYKRQALGMAVAARENGETDRHVVAVIGDGAMSGGLAFEGLNNVSSTPNRCV